MNESELVERLRRLFPKIGDDAAVIGDQVITTDMLVEDVDFTRAIPMEFVARKSLAVNLSDLAAMGATPLYAVVALGAPEWLDIEGFMTAMAGAATKCSRSSSRAYRICPSAVRLSSGAFRFPWKAITFSMSGSMR